MESGYIRIWYDRAKGFETSSGIGIICKDDFDGGHVEIVKG
jgi:hypothetical protein